MGVYFLKGKVRDQNNQSVKDIKILSFDDDPVLNPDDLLGEATTNSSGLFKIEFDESKFQPFWEFLEETPDVYIILKNKEDRQLLKTKIMQTRKELEYQIKLVENIPNTNAKDIYADNLRRIVNMLGDVGNLIGLESSINLNSLENLDLPKEIQNSLLNFASGFDERTSNFNHFMALLSGVVNSFLEETFLASIGYDGPQVPRLPRREAYNQIIIWPRAEEFKWE
jgi:hypothetical protein